ncbi:MAG: FtsW/RodA/SpoVE family cell cycle protein [Blautia sp.]|nr:FtsW/RodA/SpoVE family cell cycle protein [Blautia sp.]
MVNIFVELSKYVILTLMVLYTFHCASMVFSPVRGNKEWHLFMQLLLMFGLDSLSFLVLFLQQKDLWILLYYLAMMALFVLLQLAYRTLYPKASGLLLNNTCMMLSLGFIMLCRLDMASAAKQLIIAAVASGLFLAVPSMIRQMRFLKKLAWLYGGAGVLILMAVLGLAQSSYGAKLSLMGIQPSEAIKITFVFFAASMLWHRPTKARIMITAFLQAVQIGILVLSRDLGSALIFFVTFLIMLYISTRRAGYLALGLGVGSVASVVAYHSFAHVRERVSAFLHPLLVYENEGYQIVQSLFAIGTGGWFGMGLGKGSPQVIPVVKNDFIFSAVCEELGAVFALCLIALCMMFFLIIVNISLQIRNPFYKLVAIGLGTEYAFQVFLTIGGAIKMIPLTGVTLPLISYGGSSLVSTLLVLAIIQGLFIYREDEEEEIERLRRQTEKASLPFGFSWRRKGKRD